VIILDTNVISALMRSEPDPVVVRWLDALPPESLWTTAITVFEVRLGLEVLAEGSAFTLDGLLVTGKAMRPSRSTRARWADTGSAARPTVRVSGETANRERRSLRQATATLAAA
jgi:predicted nucleic acid-binding protein